MFRKKLNELKDASLIWRLKNDTSSLLSSGSPLQGRNLTISLTSVPARLHLVDLTLASLLSQSVKPTRIVLWIPDTIDVIPDNVQAFERRGITVKLCKDVGPHTKLVHSLNAYPEDVIVTADDDTLYPKNWLADLVSAHQKEPSVIHCHRAHYITFDANQNIAPYIKWGWLAHGVQGKDARIFPTGVGGVLYPPGSLHADATNIELFQQLSPRADDIWFKVMAVLNGTQTSKIRAKFREYPTMEGSQEASKLGPENVKGGGNDKQLEACLQHYKLPAGVFMER